MRTARVLRPASLVTASVVLGLLVLFGINSAYVAAQAPSPLTIGRSQDISSWDPQRLSQFSDEMIWVNVFDTLVSRNAAGQIQPALATSWRIVTPTSWEFKLRTGVRFQDGEPFDAQAVKYSFDRALNPNTKWTRVVVFRPLKDVRVIDDHTVRIDTNAPWPLLLPAMAAYGWIVPPGYIEKNGEDALNQHPIGTGPYKFVQWTKDDRITLEANTDYWGGRPRIQQLIIRTIPNEGARLSELLAGSVDMINYAPPQDYVPIQRSPQLKLVNVSSRGIYFLLFRLVNTAKPSPLQDKRVRQALNYAVDVNAIAKSVMHGAVQRVATFCVSDDFGCDNSIAPYPYDPAQARALLRQAGYPNGFSMSIATTSDNNPGDRDMTLAAAQQLGNVGVKANVVILETGVWLKELYAKTVPQDAVYNRTTGLLGYASDKATQLFDSKGIAAQWYDPRMDSLLETAEATLDPAQARAILRTAQLYFKDQAPAIPLFTSANSYGMSRRLRWTPHPDGRLPMVEASWQ